jgi:hypothetical protein
MKAHRHLACIVLGATLLGCGSPPTEEPINDNEILGRVTSPNLDDGAAIIEITGPGIRGLAADDGIVFRHESVGALEVVIIRPVPGIITFRLGVDDDRAAFTAHVLQVVDGNNEVRASTAGYAVELDR